jgi:hypothetical protein
MKRIIPFIIIILLPVLGFSQADSVSYGPGYTNQVWYNFANGEVHTSDNTSWDIAFGIGGFNTDIRINDGFGVALYLYPNGDTAAWNTIDTNGLQNWTPRFNSDTSWTVTAFADASVSHPDYGWGKYNSTTHEVYGDSIYIIELTDGSFKKIKMGAMATDGTMSFMYADIDGNNETTGVINKLAYTSKKHVYYSLTTDAILDLEPANADWDIVFTKYNQPQPQGGYYKVTGVLMNDGRTVAEARGVDLANTGWYGQDYTTNIGTIGADWKKFNMGTFAYDIVDSLTYFVADTNDMVWQLTFTGFVGSSTGKVYFNTKQVGALSVEKSQLAVNNVSVYPNPAIETFTVSVESEIAQNDLMVTVYSLTGSIVYTEKMAVSGLTNSQISVSNWQKGMYLVRIGNDNNAVVKQLIVK